MEFRVLGPLVITRNGEELSFSAEKQRSTLGLLLLHGDKVVSSERLIDELWGGRPPATAQKLVHVYVSQLRKRLGEDAIVTRPTGYLLRLDGNELDAYRFERLVGEARQCAAGGSLADAAALYHEALSLWRGPALDDAPFQSVARSEVDQLDELRLQVLTERIDCELTLGRHEQLIGELETLVATHPLRERLCAQLMLALFRSGRQAEALAAYRTTRRVLSDELGLEPSEELQQLQHRILRHDASLRLSPATSDAADETQTNQRYDEQAVSAATRRSRGLALGVAVTVLGLAVAISIVAALFRGDSGPKKAAAPIVLPRNAVGLIDTGSNSVTKVVRVGALPRDIAVSAGFVWVAKEFQRTVTRIDPETGETASVGVAIGPTGVVATPSAVWAVGRVGPILSVARVGLTRIDPLSMAPTLNIRLQEPLTLPRPPHGTGGPVAPAVTATADAVWVTGGRTVWRIDPETAKVVAEVRLSDYIAAIAAGEGAIWMCGTSTPLVKIDPRTNAVVATRRRVASEPVAIAAGADAIWVTDRTEKTVRRYDPVTADETAVVRLDTVPGAVTVADGSVWVANTFESSVSRVDRSTNRVVDTITTGRSTLEALSPGAGGVWVVASGS